MTGPSLDEVLDEIERIETWIALLPPGAPSGDDAFVAHVLAGARNALRTLAEAIAFDEAKARHAFMRSPS